MNRDILASAHIGTLSEMHPIMLSYLSHVSHHSILLSVNETLQHYPDGHINVITVNILS